MPESPCWPGRVYALARCRRGRADGRGLTCREVRGYLQQFSDVEQSRFAIVKVGGGVLQDDLDALASALAFLHRLGLIPIVLHGAVTSARGASSTACSTARGSTAKSTVSSATSPTSTLRAFVPPCPPAPCRSWRALAFLASTS